MFVQEVDSHKCYACMEVLMAPQLLPCGHNFCYECVQQIQQCALCRGPLVPTPNIELEFEIGSSRVHCPNERFGCNQSIVLFQFDIHIAYECEHIPVVCPNGCGHAALSLDAHTPQTCIDNYKRILEEVRAATRTQEGIAEQRRQEVEAVIATN